MKIFGTYLIKTKLEKRLKESPTIWKLETFLKSKNLISTPITNTNIRKCIWSPLMVNWEWPSQYQQDYTTKRKFKAKNKFATRAKKEFLKR